MRYVCVCSADPAKRGYDGAWLLLKVPPITNMENYTRGKVLGKGSFGSAILCTKKSDGKQVVIKEIDISRMPPAERVSSKQEATVRHPPSRQHI